MGREEGHLTECPCLRLSPGSGFGASYQWESSICEGGIFCLFWNPWYVHFIADYPPVLITNHTSINGAAQETPLTLSESKQFHFKLPGSSFSLRWLLRLLRAGIVNMTGGRWLIRERQCYPTHKQCRNCCPMLKRWLAFLVKYFGR